LIWAVAFSPDGSRIVGLDDNDILDSDESLKERVRIWRTDQPTADPLVLKVSGRMYRQGPLSPIDPIDSIAFSRNGSRLVTLFLSSEGATARLWHLDSLGEPPILLSGVINAAAFTPDGSRVVTVDEYDGAQLWRVEQPTEPRVLFGRRDSVEQLAFRDDSRLVTLGPGGMARIWSLDPSGDRLHVSADDPRIEGDPETLLREWQRRLALEIREDGEIGPVMGTK
jgi:WD40 repeat protein